MDYKNLERLALEYFKKNPSANQIWITKDGLLFSEKEVAQKRSTRFNLGKPNLFERVAEKPKAGKPKTEKEVSSKKDK
jgi:hypothetical protein